MVLVIAETTTFDWGDGLVVVVLLAAVTPPVLIFLTASEGLEWYTLWCMLLGCVSSSLFTMGCVCVNDQVSGTKVYCWRTTCRGGGYTAGTAGTAGLATTSAHFRRLEAPPAHSCVDAPNPNTRGSTLPPPPPTAPPVYNPPKMISQPPSPVAGLE